MKSSIESKKEVLLEWEFSLCICVHTRKHSVLHLKGRQESFKLGELKWHYNNILKHSVDNCHRKYFFNGTLNGMMWKLRI